MGENCIKKASEINFSGYRFVINAGVCGSVNPEFKLFDVVIPESASIEQQEESIKIHTEQLNKLKLKKAGIKLKGNLKTLLKPVFSRKEKEKLFKQKIDLIDMECYHFLKIYEKIIPLKAITDTLNTENSKKSHLKHISEGLEKLKKATALLLKSLL